MTHAWPQQRFTCNRSQPLRWTSHRGTLWWRRYFLSILPCQRQNVEVGSIQSDTRSPGCRLKQWSVTRRWHPRPGRTTSTPPRSTWRWPRAGEESSRASGSSHLDAVGNPHWCRPQPHWGIKRRVKWRNTSGTLPLRFLVGTLNVFCSKYVSFWWKFLCTHF